MILKIGKAPEQSIGEDMYGLQLTNWSIVFKAINAEKHLMVKS